MNQAAVGSLELLEDETPGSVAVKNIALEESSVEKSILKRISAGDDSAVEDCLQQYGGLVWSMARRMCPQDADDATQEIFMEIWQKAKHYRSERGSESTFIVTIARRRLIDRLRRNRNLPERSSELVCDVASVEEVDRLELADEAAKAAECMSRLSDRQQRILTLSIHHGASHSGIAKRLRIPLGSVKSYARRALIQLRDCMQRPVAEIDGVLS